MSLQRLNAITQAVARNIADGGRQITVTEEQLRNAATQINHFADQYRLAVSQMYQEIDSMGSEWTDAMNQEFVAQMQSFVPDFRAMYDWLKAYVEHLNTSAHQYADSKQHVKQRAQALVRPRGN